MRRSERRPDLLALGLIAELLFPHQELRSVAVRGEKSPRSVILRAGMMQLASYLLNEGLIGYEDRIFAIDDSSDSDRQSALWRSSCVPCAAASLPRD